MPSMFAGDGGGPWRKIAGLLAVGLLAALLVAPHANGQAAADQYVPNPNPSGGSGAAGQSGSGGNPKPGDRAADDAGLGAVAAETGSGSGAGGTLPFTGFPMTPLILIALALLCAALLVRLAARVTQRIRA